LSENSTYFFSNYIFLSKSIYLNAGISRVNGELTKNILLIRLQEWLQTETELTRERGLWGPPTPTILDKWMLDMTEGPCRMRKKMMKNELFYIHYPYRPELEHPDNVSCMSLR